MLTWFTTRMEAAPADRLDWMEALANHVGFSPAWLRPPAVTRSALGCQSSVGSGTRAVGPRKPGFWCEVGESMPGPELLLIAQWLKLVPSCRYIGIQSSNRLTRAPLGYFYNAPHWGGGLFRAPPPDLRNYWADSKNLNGIWKTWKNCRGKTNFIDLGVTSDVTGQVKVKLFDISGLVTSASKIAMLSTNKAN